MIAVFAESDYRFTIYYVYEEESANCDLIWDVYYRFAPDTREYGKHLCLDFEVPGKRFITATNLGYLCNWSIEHQKLINAYQIVNPVSKQVEILSMIRGLEGQKQTISFSLKSQNLMLTEQVKSDYTIFHSPKSHTHVEKLEVVFKTFNFDVKKKGNVTNLKVDLFDTNLVTSFQNGSITIFKVATQE